MLKDDNHWRIRKSRSIWKFKIRDEKNKGREAEPFWKQKKTLRYISALLLVVSWFLGEQYGEEHVLPTLYAASILIGGYSLFIKDLKNFNKIKFRYEYAYDYCHYRSCDYWWMGWKGQPLLSICSQWSSRGVIQWIKHVNLLNLQRISPQRSVNSTRQWRNDDSCYEIQVGDIMIVKPSKLAMDGIVVKGTSTLIRLRYRWKCSVTKITNDEVFAGTLNEEVLRLK